MHLLAAAGSGYQAVQECDQLVSCLLLAATITNSVPCVHAPLHLQRQSSGSGSSSGGGASPLWSGRAGSGGSTGSAPLGRSGSGGPVLTRVFSLNEQVCGWWKAPPVVHAACIVEVDASCWPAVAAVALHIVKHVLSECHHVYNLHPKYRWQLPSRSVAVPAMLHQSLCT
jgi:hypothetical protein